MDIASPTASKLYGAAVAASQPIPTDAPLPKDIGGVEESAAPSFVQTVGEVAQDLVETLVSGEQTTKAMMAGKADAQAVVEALAATEMALEMAVAVRDKVVEAYQEILRMPV